MVAVWTLVLIDRKQSERRQKEDLQIENKRVIVDIPDIEFEFPIPVDRVPAVDLRPPGDAGLDLVSASLKCVVMPIELKYLRAWANEAHLPRQHVEELRQLIEAAQSQESTQGSNPMFVGNSGSTGQTHRVCHRPELENM